MRRGTFGYNMQKGCHGMCSTQSDVWSPDEIGFSAQHVSLQDEDETGKKKEIRRDSSKVWMLRHCCSSEWLKLSLETWNKLWIQSNSLLIWKLIKINKGGYLSQWRYNRCCFDQCQQLFLFVIIWYATVITFDCKTIFHHLMRKMDLNQTASWNGLCLFQGSVERLSCLSLCYVYIFYTILAGWCSCSRHKNGVTLFFCKSKSSLACLGPCCGSPTVPAHGVALSLTHPTIW